MTLFKWVILTLLLILAFKRVCTQIYRHKSELADIDCHISITYMIFNTPLINKGLVTCVAILVKKCQDGQTSCTCVSAVMLMPCMCYNLDVFPAAWSARCLACIHPNSPKTFGLFLKHTLSCC